MLLIGFLAVAAIDRPWLFVARAPGEAAIRLVHNHEGWFSFQRAYPTGRLPTADALDRVPIPTVRPPSIRPNLSIPGDRWVSIGPQPIVVNNNLPFAGRVTAVAAHPTNANILYIGTDSGGIWTTTNAGATWTSLTDAIPVPAIQSLAIDPVNPQLLYATTIHRTYPVRLLRSTSGGTNWEMSSIIADGQTLSPAPCSVNVFKACIPPSSGRIFLDPTRAGSPNTSTVFFTGASHLFRSDDSGRTFHAVLTLPTELDFGGSDAAAHNPEAQFLRDAAIDPTRPGRLFAAVAQPRCLNDACTTMDSLIALFRSLDAGAHWTRQDVGSLGAYSLANTRYADPGPVYVPRARVAVAPSSPDTVALAFRDVPRGQPRLFKSTNGGDTWSETASPSGSLTWPLGLAFAPTDANTIYVSSNGVHRSLDGGQTWANMLQTHADNIVVTFDANRTLLIGGDGGVYRGTTGQSITALHGALPITEFYSVAAHPTNPLLLAGGTQDNGTTIFQGNLGWSEILGGDGGDTAFDPTSPAVLYAEVEWYFDAGSNVFDFFRCQPGGCVVRSSGIDKSLNGPFIPRFGVDRQDPAALWLTAEKLFRTLNRGDAWTAMTPSVANNQRCWTDPVTGASCARAQYFVAVGIAPSSSATVYAGALNGDVWVTGDRGQTWRSVAGPTAGPLPVRAVNDIVVDPLNPGTAYVSFSGFDSNGSGSGHVFRTADFGASWQDVSGNLPDVPVNTLLIDPDSIGSAPVIYAGTDIGVFRVTLDGAANWQPFGSGLPPVVVNRLAYNATTHQLLAATYGRGVWAISSRFSR
jgi:photosystem II stability/assembly factor-like uncharacterized protein